MTQSDGLIYGAYGYTGELIAREASRRGLRPILAGRAEGPLRELARQLDLPFRTFPLDDQTGLERSLAGVTAVLHCAGPFLHTSRPMVEACLASGCHYLDITGEVAVFESIFQRSPQAVHAGVALLPGVGLDVVPTDCLAARLGQQMPTATLLELAWTSEGGGLSRGTLCTMIEGLPIVGAERAAGELQSRPPAFASRRVDFPHRSQWTMAIPWGDLATAYRTTGIPNIRVYLGSSRRRIARLRQLAPLLPVLSKTPCKRTLQWWVRQRVTGPTATERESARSYFWGRVEDSAGKSETATLETPEGYSLTASTAVESLRRVLEGRVEPGAWTPARAFGSDFIKSFEGVVASW